MLLKKILRKLFLKTDEKSGEGWKDYFCVICIRWTLSSFVNKTKVGNKVCVKSTHCNAMFKDLPIVNFIQICKQGQMAPEKFNGWLNFQRFASDKIWFPLNFKNPRFFFYKIRQLFGLYTIHLLNFTKHRNNVPSSVGGCLNCFLQWIQV